MGHIYTNTMDAGAKEGRHDWRKRVKLIGAPRRGPLPGKQCKPMMGLKFGRLEVVGQHIAIYKMQQWKCRCACGKEVVVCGSSLRKGKTQSCGCLRRENTAKLASSRYADRPAKEKSAPTAEQRAARAERERERRAAKRAEGRGQRAEVASRRAERVLKPKLEAMVEAAEVASKAARKKQAEVNDARRAAMRRGEAVDLLPARKVAALDGAGWLRLIILMRRSGAKWRELEEELASAAAHGVTRAVVEEAMAG